MSSATVIGMQELGAKLDKLTREDAKKAIRAAAKPAIEVFRREIRKNTPVRVELAVGGLVKRKTKKDKKERKPGYAKAHVSRWLRPNADGSFSAYTGYTLSAFYMRFYEDGTSHQPPRPVVRPAYESKKNEAEVIFGLTLYTEILKGLR